MYKASKDGILERKEFKNWCSNNYSTIFNVLTILHQMKRKDVLMKGLYL